MVIFALALMAAPATGATAKAQADSPLPKMAKLLENCDAHKFETVIEVPVGAVMKHSRLRLCGTEGQSDADWIRTLKDAVGKTEANAEMPKPVRDQILTALNGEIARLSVSGSALAGGLPPRTSSKSPVLDGISPLPPLPEPRQAEPTAALPPPRMVAPALPSRDYAALPPLPTTVTAPTHVLPGATAFLPALPRPRMHLICYNPGDVGEGPCADFARDTMITVGADEDLPGGISLRFVRNGEARADVELAQLRKGKTQRFALPSEVCSHVSGAKLEIRIVRNIPAAGPLGQEVGKDGPYNLRC